MIKKLRDQVYNIGLFAAIPALDEQNILRAADALVKGGIRGIIIPWDKSLAPAVKKMHTRYPQVLIGVQGLYDKTNRVDFIVDTTGISKKAQAPFLLRKGNNLLDGSTVLAQCANKLVLVSDVKKQKWEEITHRAQQSLQKMLGFELRHVGINHPDVKGAENTADQFEHLFGFTKTDKGGAYFAGPYIEAMKKMFYGTHGHIAIATNHPARAAWYLEQRGAKFNWKSADYNEDGSLRVVYLQDEIGGFAVHIIQK